MKIFVGVTEIAGYHNLVSRGLRERGHRVYFLQLNANQQGYGLDGGGVWTTRINRLCFRLFKGRTKSLVRKLIWKSTITALKIGSFIWSLFFVKYYIFGFATSFLPWHLDLPVLRLFRKKVLFVFHGSDSRPSYLDFGGVYNSDGKRFSVSEVAAKTKNRKKIVKRVGKWADWVIDNPASAHFHEFPIINHFVIGNPVEKRVASDAMAATSDEVVALHAPTAPLAKGSPVILAAISSLQESLPLLRFKTISGRPHQEVIQALKECDFVIDQLYSDTPAAGFAIESASFGKPAIVGGYGWGEGWLKMTGLNEYPSFVCHPKDLAKAITNLAEDKALRIRLGEAALRLAGTWHYTQVAEKFELILKNQSPEEWYFDPAEVPQFYSGGGLDESVVAHAVHELTSKFGWGALEINDKPSLLASAQNLVKKYHETVTPSSVS